MPFYTFERLLQLLEDMVCTVTERMLAQYHEELHELNPTLAVPQRPFLRMAYADAIKSVLSPCLRSISFGLTNRTLSLASLLAVGTVCHFILTCVTLFSVHTAAGCASTRSGRTPRPARPTSTARTFPRSRSAS